MYIKKSFAGKIIKFIDFTNEEKNSNWFVKVADRKIDCINWWD